MKIEILKRKNNSGQNQKLSKAYDKMEQLIVALNAKELSEAHVKIVREDLNSIDSFAGSDKELIILLNKAYKTIMAYINKELKLVKKFHYQNLWMIYGIFAGILFATVFDNFLGTSIWNSTAMGVSMGLLFGLLAGRNRDYTAKKEGLQLDI